MCGIVGFNWNEKELIKKMTDVVRHRGPDSGGIYTDNGITLGHRRLSIIDLSNKGREPMSNEDGSVWLVFNGEIYNFKEIREDLEKKKHRFRSNTDAEVIIHAYEEYKEGCLNLFEGIFTFAIWDSNDKTLLIARDPIGIKPLYYWLNEGKIIFASEIKSILECDEVKREANRHALGKFLRYRYVSGDETFFSGIKKLMPGNYLKIKGNKVVISQYWEINKNNSDNTFAKLFEKSVKEQLISDVPLGVFLSGGLDSSSIVGVMKRFTRAPIKTFTAGFNDSRDEFRYAKTVADYFQTEHHEVYIDYDDMTKVFPKLVWHLDEPVADPAILPTYFLAKLAKRKVTVALVGEGSDELFAGYSKYKSINSNPLIPKNIRLKIYSEKDIGFTESQTKSLTGFKEKNEIYEYIKNSNDPLTKAQIYDFKAVMPNFQLMKVDKMTMANSLEARVPYLSKYMTNFAFSLPENVKLRKNMGKFVVRESLKKVLPQDVIYGSKRTFFTPLKKWFENGLMNHAHNLLSKEKIRESNLFNYKSVEKVFKLQKNSIRRFRYSNQLWMLLMVQVWYDTYFKK